MHLHYFIIVHMHDIISLWFIYGIIIRTVLLQKQIAILACSYYISSDGSIYMI